MKNQEIEIKIETVWPSDFHNINSIASRPLPLFLTEEETIEDAPTDKDNKLRADTNDARLTHDMQRATELTLKEFKKISVERRIEPWWEEKLSIY